MKREIKFRAWDPEAKKMIYKPATLRRVTYNEECNGFHMGRVKSKDNGDWVQFEIMQFTGLKDKKGKEIYEGDVIECLDSNGKPIRHAVVYDEPRARFAVVFQNWTPGSFDQDWINEFGKQVIGNRFENPELLDFNITE